MKLPHSSQHRIWDPHKSPGRYRKRLHKPTGWFGTYFSRTGKRYVDWGRQEIFRQSLPLTESEEVAMRIERSRKQSFSQPLVDSAKMFIDKVALFIAKVALFVGPWMGAGREERRQSIEADAKNFELFQ